MKKTITYNGEKQRFIFIGKNGKKQTFVGKLAKMFAKKLKEEGELPDFLNEKEPYNKIKRNMPR